MTTWTYYDWNGKRVALEDAVFKGKEVSAGVSVLPDSPSLRTEYQDVHASGQPGLRKSFKSFVKMEAWFKEHAAGAKGGTRSD
jgi:hypothetical protein